MFSLLYLASLIPVEDQIPSTVRNRHMPAIKHDDIVVRNSKVCYVLNNKSDEIIKVE